MYIFNVYFQIAPIFFGLILDFFLKISNNKKAEHYQWSLLEDSLWVSVHISDFTSWLFQYTYE